MERDFQINWPLLVEEAIRRRHGIKLTQKQLAMLAKVSTPTVSRFELAAKDVQLSSALAILDVLGMTDTRTLVFDEGAKLDADDSIVFGGKDDEKRVRFRVSREALDDHFSDGGRLRSEAAFKKHRHEIEGLARRKYLLGHKEPDGTVVLETLDIAGP
jgi:transcriptional regulator with XRE-family HTH domain